MYPPKWTILKVDFAHKLSNCTFYMAQINPEKIVHNTTYSVEPPYIAGHSL